MATHVLQPHQLYTACDAAQFAFTSTAELPDLDSVIGQDRSVEAICFGVGIRHEGYNLYALGPSRCGKRTVITQLIEQRAKEEAVPDDWIYVNNFIDPHKPNAFSLPAGMGVRFRQDMLQLVEELRNVVPAALESDEYRARSLEIEGALKERQEKAFEELHSKAKSHDISMLRTPSGFVFAPTIDGEVIKAEDFKKLPEREKKKIGETIANLQEQLEYLIEQGPKWRREAQQEIKQLNRDVIMAAVGQLINELRSQYEQLPEVLAYLDEVQQDVIDHADQFRQPEEAETSLSDLFLPEFEKQTPVLKRYRVNVMTDQTNSAGAPIVHLDNPTYPNLIGRVEHEAHMGALFTDFSMIKAGALHQANGGYLIIDARKLLIQPYAWEGIKRALTSRKIVIESLGQMLSLVSTASLEPEPIPLDVKIVLLGERLIYYLLCEYDPEFNELFKVAADFDDMISRTPDNDQRYALFLATYAESENLRPLDPAATARLIEHSSRMVEDAEKLSSRFGKVADFLREADYWAAQSSHDVVTADDVQKAIDAHDRRLSRIRERLREETLRGTLMIDSEGQQPGQVNGLSVIKLGDYVFAHPVRITARVRMGKGEVVDIEREIKLGGPIHSKGVLIMRGFLSGRYCPEQTLSLSASLVFEQTYGSVEGDSASSAELYALMSALAEVPIKQSLAVTGSVNQHGQIQAIGGVNEKIEGFFDLCNSRGLNGEQGVLIPAANVKHLMLNKDVIDAVAENKFHIYAVETVDDGITILTGVVAGERDDSGNFPDKTINRLVEARLQAMAEHAHEQQVQDEK